MRNGFLLFAFFLYPFAPDAIAVAPDKQVPFLGGFLKESRVVYPLQIGEWKASGEHLYDQQESGVSVRYLHGADRDRWIDLYFYPAGVLSEGQFVRMVESEADGLRQARLQAGDKPEMGESRKYPFPSASSGDPGTSSAYSIDMVYERGGKRYNSAMTILMDRLYFIKGRFSVHDDLMSRKKTRELLEEFTAQLVSRVTITSSGACWMPLPIERLHEGQAAPEKSLATLDTGSEVTDFLFEDKVLSRNPDGPGAKTLMLAGMAKRGQLFSGCDGGNPANPDVPEGMRELRLEYRSPASEPVDGIAREGSIAG